MNGEFKIVEFDCKFIMQVKIEDGMNEEQIKERIDENFDYAIEYRPSELEETEYSAYMIYKDIKNIVVTNRNRL